jgi:chromosomal replication initiator protein
VAAHYDVEPAEILAHRRTAGVVIPRQVAMYLAKTLTGRSLPDIGRRFGGRDHTTILHGVRKIAALMQRDAALAEDVAVLTAELAGGREGVLREHPSKPTQGVGTSG